MNFKFRRSKFSAWRKRYIDKKQILNKFSTVFLIQIQEQQQLSMKLAKAKMKLTDLVSWSLVIEAGSFIDWNHLQPKLPPCQFICMMRRIEATFCFTLTVKTKLVRNCTSPYHLRWVNYNFQAVRVQIK